MNCLCFHFEFQTTNFSLVQWCWPLINLLGTQRKSFSVGFIHHQLSAFQSRLQRAQLLSLLLVKILKRKNLFCLQPSFVRPQLYPLKSTFPTSRLTIQRSHLKHTTGLKRNAMSGHGFVGRTMYSVFQTHRAL